MPSGLSISTAAAEKCFRCHTVPMKSVISRFRSQFCLNQKSNEIFKFCMSYSGRCMLSAFMTSPEVGWTHDKFGSDKARHANLGDCVQPCRFKFSLVEENRKDLKFCKFGFCSKRNWLLQHSFINHLEYWKCCWFENF